MLYSISGTIALKREHFFVIDAGNVSFRIFTSAGTLAKLPDAGAAVKIYSHLHVREDALELYGFLSETEIALFEQLNSVSGIGPKSALGILGVANIDQLVAAINEGKTELLTRASGIGKRTAERIVLELKGKLSATAAPQTLRLMESDVELEETLISLGYTRPQAKMLIANIDPSVAGFQERLRAALKKGKNGA